MPHHRLAYPLPPEPAGEDLRQAIEAALGLPVTDIAKPESATSPVRVFAEDDELVVVLEHVKKTLPKTTQDKIARAVGAHLKSRLHLAGIGG